MFQIFQAPPHPSSGADWLFSSRIIINKYGYLPFATRNCSCKIHFFFAGGKHPSSLGAKNESQLLKSMNISNYKFMNICLLIKSLSMVQLHTLQCLKFLVYCGFLLPQAPPKYFHISHHGTCSVVLWSLVNTY